MQEAEEIPALTHGLNSRGFLLISAADKRRSTANQLVVLQWSHIQSQELPQVSLSTPMGHEGKASDSHVQPGVATHTVGVKFDRDLTVNAGIPGYAERHTVSNFYSSHSLIALVLQASGTA